MARVLQVTLEQGSGLFPLDPNKPPASYTRQLVLRSQDECDALLQAYGTSRSLQAKIGPGQIVVAILFGIQGSGSNTGEITAIEDTPDALIVHSVLRIPNGGSADVAVPYHFVAIAETAKKIVFEPTVTYNEILNPSR